MKLAAIHTIRVADNRQRQEFNPDAQSELIDSIAKHGLMHAIVLRVEGDDYTLVAGERRLRAIRELPMTGQPLRHDGATIPEGMIPYVCLGDLDPLAAEEAEAEENLRRLDLTWQEKAAAVAKIASIRKRQAVAKSRSEPTVAEIAAETFSPSRDGFDAGDSAYGAAATRKQLIVSRYLDDPEVTKAKGLDDAFKILKRREAAEKNVALAARVGVTFSAALHSLHNADALSWLQCAEPNQFDVILTDPPYGMGADEFGAAGARPASVHFYRDDYETWQELMDVLCPQAFRLAKPQAHLYIFCDLDRFYELRERLKVAGWWVHRTPLIWHKPSVGSVPPWPEHGPRRNHELIAYAVKGKRPTTGILPDVISCNADTNLGHPAQKPIALLLDLLKRSTRPGDTVLDPFCGSGSIFPAANSLKVKATGVELDQAAYGLALQRLQQLKEEGL